MTGRKWTELARWTLVAPMLTAAPIVAAAAQTLTRDPVTLDYTLRYRDDDGTERVLTVQAADKIDPALGVRVETSGAGRVYRYTLRNRASARARSPIESVNIRCPSSEAGLAVAAPAPHGGLITHQRVPTGQLRLCVFLIEAEADEARRPEQMVDGLEIRSNWLPGIRHARAWGLIESVGYPTDDMPPASVAALVESVQGFDFERGGGVKLRVVAPARAPSELADPARGLTLIRGDLAASCGELAWIAQGAAGGTCTSLRAKLDAAAAALAAGNRQEAANQLGALVNELDALRGGQVSENAYWLLRTNVQYVRERLF
jgi:FIMAH domain-containing protein